MPIEKTYIKNQVIPVFRRVSGLAVGIFFFLSLVNIPSRVNAQFYNGHQMSFGKNRVQFNDFFWSYYRFDRFDTYFNQYGQELARYTAWYAEQELDRIERFFDYRLEKRLIFLNYNRLSDFRESNIGLVTGSSETNIGGVTQIIDNKVFLLFQGDRDDYRQQISKAIARVVINEMLYGNEVRENVANSTLINLPEWYINGLESYVSEKWNVDIDSRVRDGISSRKFRKLNRLTNEDALYAGHSFWHYLVQEHGAKVIPDIIYLTRINKNVKNSFLNVLGYSMKELNAVWLDYYMNLYAETSEGENIPENTRKLSKPKKERVFTQVKISPTSEHIAYVTNESGRYTIWLHDTSTGKRKKIIRMEHKLEQIQDYSYPVLAWHPTGKIITWVSEVKGRLKLNYYTLETKEYLTRNLLVLDKVLDYSFSNDAVYLVMSGQKSGRTDIYLYNIPSSTFEQITNDLADDHHPRFIDNARKILFSSTRVDPTLGVNPFDPAFAGKEFRLFVYDLSRRDSALMLLSDVPYANHTSPIEIAPNEYAYLSDESGIRNRYKAEFDSTISFIDTTIHYRYFANSSPLTNYSRSIQNHDLDLVNKESMDVMYHKNRWRMFSGPLNLEPIEKPRPTAFRKIFARERAAADSLEARKRFLTSRSPVQPKQARAIDTIPTSTPLPFVDINNYQFDAELMNTSGDQAIQDTSKQELSESEKIRVYFTAFYPNYLVTQIDFGFLNSTYQAFTGGAVYYNPGFNAFFKVGTNDLFEDYKIVGGIRIAGDFDSNEYLLSFENLKKRLNRQFVFHRQAFKNITSNYQYIKTHSHELRYMLGYPLSQVAAIRGTVSFRHDRTVFLATDLLPLARANNYLAWGGLKGEFVFDNTRSLGINLYSGTRLKLFAETFRKLDNWKSDLYVLGADIRHYVVIHRNLIWANRFATSTSFGHNRLIYYLGSVDNWTNFSSKVPTFDQSIPIDQQERYAYQTLATNMRGFTQNIRNGNNFAVANTEIRLPIIQYFANYPISSNFWSSLQAVGFFDVGSAWTGLSPYSGKNAYDKDIINMDPITVILDSNRSPIVAGYGFGARAQLLGYFIRLDWAWGIENNVILPRIFYFSLCLDF